MFNLLKKLFTKNMTEIPLLYVNFNYKKYKEEGSKNSCTVHVHPLLKDDKDIEIILRDLIDYIRDEYDMEEI